VTGIIGSLLGVAYVWHGAKRFQDSCQAGMRKEFAMWRWLKRFVLAAAILLAMAQAFRPAKTNPPVDPKREIGATLPLDPVVGSVLEHSCNDCHSSRTVWQRYSGVAPASWLVVSDVNRGRKELNFSNWASYGPADQRKHLSEICKEMTEGETPGLPYVLLHPRAAVGKADVAAVCRWTAEQSAMLARKN
jgi:hypothetical protein